MRQMMFRRNIKVLLDVNYLVYSLSRVAVFASHDEFFTATAPPCKQRKSSDFRAPETPMAFQGGTSPVAACPSQVGDAT